jgi:sulfate adenylyltransferase
MHPEHDYSESLLVHFRRIESLKKAALDYPSVLLDTAQLCDLELLLNRAFYPLCGYLDREDYESVIAGMRLGDGALWPIPVCLDVSYAMAGTLETGQAVALRDGEGFMLAVLTVSDVWKPDKKAEAHAVFGTDDPKQHPGVRRLYEEVGPWYIGGET